MTPRRQGSSPAGSVIAGNVDNVLADDDGNDETTRLDQLLVNIVNSYGMDAVRNSLGRISKSDNGGEDIEVDVVNDEMKVSGGALCRRGMIHNQTKEGGVLERSSSSYFATIGLLEKTAEYAFEPIFAVDENGLVLFANAAASKLFGWENENEGNASDEQRDIRQVLFGGSSGGCCSFSSKSTTSFDSLIASTRNGETATGRKSQEERMIVRRKDGRVIPIEIRLEVVYVDHRHDGEWVVCCGYAKEILLPPLPTSPRRQNEDAVVSNKCEESKLTKTIVEASFDAMIATGPDGTVTMVNDAACQTFGWSRQEFLGQNISVICGPKISADLHNGYIAKYLQGGKAKFVGSLREVQAYRKNGTTFPAELGVRHVVTNFGTEQQDVFISFVRNLSDEKRLTTMEVQKRASDALLFNMLPECIAERLIHDPSHIADHYECATILFADIVGFTAMSSRITPVELVKILNDLFSRFDALVEKYGLNKVKTIGDCYMVTSVPDVIDAIDGCGRVCQFALDMIEALQLYNEENPSRNLLLRVGVNSGPVVAGVVGTKRFLYDLWGDAVNLASRMESTGLPGKIQVSGKVVELLAPDEFTFESRGTIQVKGKGEMEAFLLVNAARECRLPPNTVRNSQNRTSMYNAPLQVVARQAMDELGSYLNGLDEDEEAGG